MEYSQNIEFNKIRTTSEIFSDYWRFMKEEWRPYCLVLGVFVLPFAFLGAYLFSQRPNELFEVLAAMEDPDFQNEFVPVGSVVSNMLLAMLCSFLAKFMGMFVSCAYVIKYMSSEQQYSFSSKRFGIDSFLPFFSQYGLTALFATIIMTVVVSFGFMLFILPGLIMLLPMSLLVYDVFITKSCFASFSRCINLCKTNWRQSFGVVFLCYFAIVILSMILGGLIPSDNSMANILLSSVLTVVSETVMIPFIFLYYSLANQNMRI